MGTEIEAFVEYDVSARSWRYFHPDPSDQPPPPFSGDIHSVSKQSGLFTGSKDYRFFGAIAGVRNETGIEPLVPPRGLPTTLSRPLCWYLEDDTLGDYDTSWLRLSEINAALDHQRVDRTLLGFETHTILGIMENLVARLGDERVRLVFGFFS